MASYGTGVLWGTPGVLYGVDVAPGGPLDLRRKILGGPAPWLTNPIPWRQRCPHVGRLDAAYAWLGDLVGFAGGSRQIDGREGVLPSDTLTLQVADPTSRYLEDGADVAQLAPGALLGLRWEVTTPAGTLTLDYQRYRVLHAPERSWDRNGREVWQTTAEAWAVYLLQNVLGDGVPVTVWAGLSPLRAAIAIKDWAATQPSPPPTVGGATTWTSVALALVWAACGAVTADGSLGSGGAHATGDALALMPDPLTTAPGQGGLTYGSVLAYLAPRLPMRLVYVEGGAILALSGSARRDSGYVVSCDAAVGGAFPVPWEAVKRTPGRAAFTRAQFWYTWLDSSLAPPTQQQRMAGQAVSTSRVNPDGALGRTHSLIQSSDAPVDATSDPVAQGVIDALLQRTLGQADPLTLTVDSACPPPAVGDEVRVCVPELDVNGYWRFLSASLPLSPAAGSYGLEGVA